MPSKRSRAGRPATPTTSYAEWKDRAEVQLERRHGVKATTIPARVWTRLYGQGRSPKEAAEQALYLPTTPARLSSGCAKRSRDAMGGTPHQRRSHLAWMQAAVRTTAAERERCAAIVESWNAAPTHDWSPAIGTALRAGYRWLDAYCPAAAR
jgi:hypothetical protein